MQKCVRNVLQITMIIIVYGGGMERFSFSFIFILIGIAVHLSTLHSQIYWSVDRRWTHSHTQCSAVKQRWTREIELNERIHLSMAALQSIVGWWCGVINKHKNIRTWRKMIYWGYISFETILRDNLYNTNWPISWVILSNFVICCQNWSRNYFLMRRKKEQDSKISRWTVIKLHTNWVLLRNVYIETKVHFDRA